MDLVKEIAYHIELHSLQGIRDCFDGGLNPNAEWEGKPLIHLLISMYTRSPRFKDCVNLFIEHGLEFENKILLAVLSDNASELEKQIETHPDFMEDSITLLCAYTPLIGSSLLHVCAEFNHVACAKVLVAHGMDINAMAGPDENGFGRQTPIFHTVNQNQNNSAEMLDFLLSHDADLSILVRGIVWGQHFPWETFIPLVNPISYALFGLLPQMHRDEKVIYETISKLMKHEYGFDYVPKNVPNQYLIK
jgi:hypothetical protein